MFKIYLLAFVLVVCFDNIQMQCLEEGENCKGKSYWDL